VVAVAFIAINAFCIYKEFFYLSLLPVALLLVVAAFFSLDKLLLAIVFFVPLSIPLSEIIPGLPIDMFLPTEPLLAGLLLLFFIKLIFDKRFDKRVLMHPVSLAIYAYLGWMSITSVTSVEPLVSFKFLISHGWFIVSFYFLTTQLFRKDINAKKFVILYVLSLTIVVIYALVRHMKYGIFDEKIAHWSANPFYKDHTSYGALLAFYLPFMFGFTFSKIFERKERYIFALLLVILIVGIIFSYSRAAWVSLMGAFGVWVLIKLRIKFWVILSGLAIIALIGIIFGNSIMRSLESNRQDSSTDLSKHVESITNVSTDASNIERVNRWHCAIKMFEDRPVFGWGPGTYAFYYAPYQQSNEKTIISTNLGNMGNAHSEYLGPLSEQGLLGPLLYLAVIITVVITGLRAIRNTDNPMLKMIGLAAIIGLFTYYIHGALNNFLDTDKASAPFWGFSALLVAMDIYHRAKKETTEPGPQGRSNY